MRHLPYLIAPILLAGCASSSGVLKMGPNTYSISVQAAPARGGSAGAKAMAHKEALAHCESLGRQLLVTDYRTQTTNQYGAGESELLFKCLPTSDPELR